MTASLREYSIQIRDLYQSQLYIKQNRIMALLTIITSIFMLTLIAVSLVIIIVSLLFFKKKKWLYWYR